MEPIMIMIKKLSKKFGDLEVLRDINLEVTEGEVVCIIGPSGSGKSTLLRCINQLETPTGGSIWYDGSNTMDKSYDVRKFREEVGMVFQRFNLFPLKTVLQNVMLAPNLTNKMSKSETKKYALELLEKVGLSDKADAYPSTLSGGQQQRVAIARALAIEPKVLLLDEPLSALDHKLRKDMQHELKKIQEAVGITFVFVTHDQEEALSMSDTVVVMDKGQVQQIGSPLDIYNEPNNAFVADFIGESNILEGVMIEDFLVELAGQKFKCLDEGFGKMTPVDIVIRPEDIVVTNADSHRAHINGEVISVTFKGVHYEIIVDVNGFKWMVQSIHSQKVGNKIGIFFSADDIHVMARSEYSGTMGDYSTFSDELHEDINKEVATDEE